MELTKRDSRLIEDIALHHVMTRDQIIALGYFTSISRANRRLATLVQNGYLERVRLNSWSDPKQALYRASKRVRGPIDSRVAALLSSRRLSPLQLDHSIAVVEVRIKLKELGMTKWLAEPQCRHRYSLAQGTSRHTEDVRPDGVAWFGNKCLFVEVDRGHVSLPRVNAKLLSYGAYIRSGVLAETYGQVQPAILFITTAKLRARHLVRLVPSRFPLRLFVHPTSSFQEIQALSEVTR